MDRRGGDRVPGAPPRARIPLPRLRFDKVALRLVGRVRDALALAGAVPNGLCVVFTVTAPIREPAKTAAALISLIRTHLARAPVPAAHAEALYGNAVRLRIVPNTSGRAVNVAGFVHNPDAAPDVLLDMAQTLLKHADAPHAAGREDEAPARDTVRQICEQLFGAKGCATAPGAAANPRARATRA